MKKVAAGIGIALVVVGGLFVYCGPLQATVVNRACDKLTAAYDAMGGDPTRATAEQGQDIADAIHMLATVNDDTDVNIASPAVIDAQRITAITSGGILSPDEALEVGQLFDKLYRDCGE